MVPYRQVGKHENSVTGNLTNKDDPTPSICADDGTKRPDVALQNHEQDPTSSSANDGTKRPDVASNSTDVNDGTKRRDLTPNSDEQNEEDDEKYARYSELYKAATAGDWNTARSIFDQDPDALAAPLSHYKLTVLHVAVASTRRNMSFFRNLVDLMVQKGITLGLPDSSGRTPLHDAAIAGNTMAVIFLVEKDPYLTRILDTYDEAPLHVAASYGHEDTIRHLLPVTLRMQPSLLAGAGGAMFLFYLIIGGFYEIAFQVLEENPRLSVEEALKKGTALDILAQKPHAFPSGMRLTFWQHLLYHVWERISPNRSISSQRKDVKNPTTNMLESKWKILQLFDGFHKEQLRQKQVLQLLKSLVEKALKFEQAADALGPATCRAASNGIHEFVVNVIKMYPQIVGVGNKHGQNLFNFAVIYRQEKVFNLIFQLASWKHLTMGFDNEGCSMLHNAAKFDSSAKIEKIPGAALQMQRELQWYKEVEKIVLPSYKVLTNKQGKTPNMLFAESHKKLVDEGERWMKDTANSCAIVAALVVTIAFAAAFTVPGGNNGDTGFPICLNDLSFMVFATSNALALFSSTTSLLMFLGILTSRYSQEDFLRALPMRLAIGLITLFFSITAMLVAFTASVHVMLSHHVTWIVIPFSFLACVPLLLFAFLQFPLLVEVVNSTFGPSIFCKQSDELLIER